MVVNPKDKDAKNHQKPEHWYKEMPWIWERGRYVKFIWGTRKANTGVWTLKRHDLLQENQQQTIHNSVTPAIPGYIYIIKRSLSSTPTSYCFVLGFFLCPRSFCLFCLFVLVLCNRGCQCYITIGTRWQFSELLLPLQRRIVWCIASCTQSGA